MTRNFLIKKNLDSTYEMLASAKRRGDEKAISRWKSKARILEARLVEAQRS